MRRWMRVVGPVVVVLGVWAAAAGYEVVQAADGLRSARASFGDAASALRGADLSVARERLADGEGSAGRAAARLTRPHVAVLRMLPVVGDDLGVATVLGDAAHRTAGAAAETLATFSDVVHDDEQATDGATVVPDVVADLHPPMRALADTLASAVEDVRAAPCDRTVDAVRSACHAFLDLAGPAVEQVELAADMTGVVPDLLGRSTPRRYLVLAASFSELRGSGGLPGSWSIMTADDGELSFEPFRDIGELPAPSSPVTPADEDVARRYGEYGVARQWRNVNFTPHFPAAARTALQMWDAEHTTSLDGVVMIGPTVIDQLVEHLGPIEVPDVTTLRSDNALQFVALDAYAVFDDHDRRKRVLGAVATAGLERLLALIEDNDVPASVEVVQALVEGGDLQMYVRDPEAQEVLGRAGADGALPEVDGEFATVVVNNLAASKVDWFTTRHVDHRVALLDDGRTRARIEVAFDNQAPTEGYPRHVLGPWTPHTEAGDNLSLVTLLCGTDCRLDPVPDEMTAGGRERGMPAWDVVLRIPAGDQRNVTLQTVTDDAWRIEDGELVVPVTHLVQPTVHDTELTITVEIPEGWRPTALPEGTTEHAGELVWRTDHARLAELEFRFSRTTAEG